VKGFELLYTPTASVQYDVLEAAHSKQSRAVDKALDFLTLNPRHPGLRSHKYESMRGPDGCDIWESYAENNAPGAYRIFWHYGRGSGKITIVAIVPHPK
jgi:hypothetical protein